jgi:hypothetical protein
MGLGAEQRDDQQVLGRVAPDVVGRRGDGDRDPRPERQRVATRSRQVIVQLEPELGRRGAIRVAEIHGLHDERLHRGPLAPLPESSW